MSLLTWNACVVSRRSVDVILKLFVVTIRLRVIEWRIEVVSQANGVGCSLLILLALPIGREWVVDMVDVSCVVSIAYPLR